MGLYTFLCTALPPLAWGGHSEWSFGQFRRFVRSNVSKRAASLFDLILRYIDIKNVELYLRQEPLDDRGSLSKPAIEEALLHQIHLPQYLLDFCAENDERERKAKFSLVYLAFFKDKEIRKTPFLRFYWDLEREIRLLLTAVRCQKEGRDLLIELQYEDPKDPFIAYLLAQKNQQTVRFPFEYQDLEEIVNKSSKEPMSQYVALNKYRFKKIEEFKNTLQFSLDYLLCYGVQLLLLEEDATLSESRGKAILNTIAKERV